MKKLLLLLLCIPALTVSSQSPFDYNQPLPASLKKALDDNYAHVRESVNREKVATIAQLPDWLIKTSPQSRLEGAKKFAQAIKDMKSTSFDMPLKYPYQGPDSRTYLIAQRKEQSNDVLTKDDAKDILRLSKKVEWLDCHPGNFFKTPQGKIALIDTEDAWMGAGTTHEYELKFALVHKLLKMGSRPYTDEAYRYLKGKHQLYMDWPNPNHVRYIKVMSAHKKICNSFLRDLSQSWSFV
ncbi:hypothetical protein Noda2021_01700 [Candidatus Dependentiae bacterium Noda2021]|nr:hypothetical protein Noda2021_01700 [Candidatus Dependentiae bacterium Noda2021]